MNCLLLITFGLFVSSYKSDAFLFDVIHHFFGMGCSADYDCRYTHCDSHLQPKCEQHSCTCTRAYLTTIPSVQNTSLHHGAKVCHSKSDCSEFVCDSQQSGIDCLLSDINDPTKPKICCCVGTHISSFTQPECSKTAQPKLISSTPEPCSVATDTSPQKESPSLQSCHAESDCDSLTCGINTTIRCLQNHFAIIPLPGKSCWCVNINTGVWTKPNPLCAMSSPVSSSQSTTKQTTPHTITTKPTITLRSEMTTPTTTTSSVPLCHQCGNGSKPCSAQELFDKKIIPRACPFAQQYCMTDVYNRNGNWFVFKRCVDEPTCKEEWLVQSSKNDKCMQFSGDSVYSESFTCHFCCKGRGCNSDIVPPNNLSLY